MTTEQQPRRRKRQKPVKNEDGDLVTPVSGLPASPSVNWAPECTACQTRTCSDCGSEIPHRLQECRHCGSDKLGKSHKCPDTVSTGTVVSSVGTRQRVKCRQCGHSWSWTVRRVAE